MTDFRLIQIKVDEPYIGESGVEAPVPQILAKLVRTAAGRGRKWG